MTETVDTSAVDFHFDVLIIDREVIDFDRSSPREERWTDAEGIRRLFADAGRPSC